MYGVVWLVALRVVSFKSNIYSYIYIYMTWYMVFMNLLCDHLYDIPICILRVLDTTTARTTTTLMTNRHNYNSFFEFFSQKC